MLGAERQSARMSKNTNNILTRSGTAFFYCCTRMATVGVKGSKKLKLYVIRVHQGQRQTDGQADDLLWHERVLQSIAR